MILAWYDLPLSDYYQLIFTPFLQQSYSTIQAKKSLTMIVTEDVLG